MQKTKRSPTKPPATPVRELVLTAEEINALIAEEEAFRNRVFISIAEGEITGEISVPTDKFLPGSKGRFLNASATFEVTLEDGVLIVTLSKAEVKGEQVPEAIHEGDSQRESGPGIVQGSEKRSHDCAVREHLGRRR